MSTKWSTEKMPDLTDQVVLVTGANSGIGFEAAKAFALKGAQTILACRNMEKAEIALNKLLNTIPNAKAEILELDLASLKSVQDFAEKIKKAYERLDILVNNAGIMMVPYGLTEDGFERQMGTNHLGHFALTGHLLELLKETPNARIVNVSSIAHRGGAMDFDDLLYENGTVYNPQAAYGRSKLANLLFTYELQRRFESLQLDIKALAAHPGVSNTNLANHITSAFLFNLMKPVMGILLQSAAMGALPTLRAATDPAAAGGTYYGPGGFREIGGYPVVVQSNQASHNIEDAKKLWQHSENLTGIQYL